MTKLGAAVTPTEPDLAPARVTPAQAIKSVVDQYSTVIARALPSHMTPERFQSTILTACRSNPDLMRCDPTSVIAAAIRAAQLGLEPNDERQLCYLIPRGGKATFQLGYRGKVELARRSGRVSRIVARTVYENDSFEFTYGTEGEGIRHKPAYDDRGGAAVWYAIAWAPGGELLDFVVLTPEDVEYHRSFSAQPDGQMWKKSYDAAARKTAVHELMKLLPQSVEYAEASAQDGRTFHLAELGPEPDHEAEDVGEVTAGTDPEGEP